MNSNNQKVLFAVFPILLITLLFGFVYKSPIYLINPHTPTVKQEYRTFCYSDNVHKGFSEIEITKNTSSTLAYNYILRDGYKYKFADAAFDANKNSYFNFSDYDYATIKIKASKGSRLQLGFSTFIDQYTDTTNGISYQISLFILPVEKEFKEIKVPLNEMYTPDWWYTENNKKEGELSKPNLSKIKEISFSNCINIKNNIEDNVEISEFSLKVDYLKYALYSSIFLLLYYSIYFIILNRKNKAKIKSINFIYDDRNLNIYESPEEESIFEYITTEYFKPELSIIDVQHATNIPERKISIIIKEKTGLNFKQFLNNLRLVEAKRLLKETDFQISEIAFKVGYGNASHFNRVFKTSENCSPNDFRKDIKTSN